MKTLMDQMDSLSPSQFYMLSLVEEVTKKLLTQDRYYKGDASTYNSELAYKIVARNAVDLAAEIVGLLEENGWLPVEDTTDE